MSGERLPSGPGPNGSTWEVGNYTSTFDNNASYQIYGLICYPASGGPHPVLMLNHGIGGIGTAQFTGCTNLAANGWVVATSTYRGEQITGLPSPNKTYTSGGQFEFCGGEVGDMLDLLAAVKALPKANASQVAMYGHSLGACVTELGIERLDRKGAAPQIAVSVDGPTDFTRHNTETFAPPTNPQTANWDQWDDGPETWAEVLPDGWVVDGAPTAWCYLCGQNGDEQAQLNGRSSENASNNPQALANPNLKFLRIQSEGDSVVVPQHGCELAADLGAGSSNYHLYPDSEPPAPYVDPPEACLPIPCNWNYLTPVPCGPWKLGNLSQTFPDWPNSPTPWRSPTFLMYECPHAVCPGPDRSPTTSLNGFPVIIFGMQSNTGVLEHGLIVGQSWPEVANFVNQFAKAFTGPPKFPALNPFQ